MTSAKFLNLTFSCISECVPIKIWISPEASHFKRGARAICVGRPAKAFEGYFKNSDEVARPILIPRGPKYFMNSPKSWRANTSVGAMYATWYPFFTAAREDKSATIVFPEPTSPSSNLDIGFSSDKFSKIFATAFACAWVSGKGSFFIKSSNSFFGTWILNALCSSLSFRQDWRKSWITKISSNEKRFLAASAHFLSLGKWISSKDFLNAGKLYFFNTSSGINSFKSSGEIFVKIFLSAKRSQREVSPRVSG